VLLLSAGAYRFSAVAFSLMFLARTMPHVMVISSEGYFYSYSIDLEHGGECSLMKQYRSATIYALRFTAYSIHSSLLDSSEETGGMAG
jgi:hypothetical protein